MRYNDILVVTNQTISNTARDSLNDLAKQLQIIINFQTGEQLVDLVDQYLPDFYFYQSGTHSELALALRTKCERLLDLNKVPQFNVEEKRLMDIFVQPHLTPFDRKDKKREFLTPEKVLTNHNRVLMLGEQGSGKTLVLREAVIRILATNTRDETPTFPILVKARDLSDNLQPSFSKTIADTISEYYSLPRFDEAAFNSLLSANNHLVLLIDGLDEIVSSDAKNNLLNSALSI